MSSEVATNNDISKLSSSNSVIIPPTPLSSMTDEGSSAAAQGGDVAAGNAEKNKGNDEDQYYPDEEEVTEGDWRRPQVEISEVKVETGEEAEDSFWKHRAKLFRWVAVAEEWKERGLGEAKLLRHRETGRIRFLLRQEKTLKIVANHYVVQSDVYCKLTPNIGSDKIWVWTVMDYADDELKNEQFALKFGQVEQAKIFKEKFEEAASINASLFDTAATAASDESAAKTSDAKEDEATTAAASTKSSGSDSGNDQREAASKSKEETEGVENVKGEGENNKDEVKADEIKA